MHRFENLNVLLMIQEITTNKRKIVFMKLSTASIKADIKSKKYSQRS
jgi:hypothetical protein